MIYIQYYFPEEQIRKEIGLQETHIAAGKHRKCAYLTLEAADYHQKLTLKAAKVDLDFNAHMFVFLLTKKRTKFC